MSTSPPSRARSRRRLPVVGLLAAALVGCALPAESAVAATTTARSLLQDLVVAAEAGSDSYSRTHFRHWVDADGDSCDTREEVLVAESRDPAVIGTGCRVLSGRWVSWYDGAVWTDPSDVDIDHVVALKEAWESGAGTWSAAERERFANDLRYAWSLDAITDNVNAAKSDRDPAQWLPPSPSAWCRYAIHWVAVKYRWRLSVDSAEHARLTDLLGGRCGDRAVALPPRAR